MNSPACDGVKLLVVVASTDPDWSFASFQVGGEGKNVLRRRGQDVSGKNVEYIGWDRAFLSTGKSLCQAQLFKPGAPETPAATPAPVASAGAPGAVNPDIAKGIRKVGANEWDIDRSVVDKILENQAELMKTARIIPDKEGDKVKGVRLFGIQSGSLLSLLGMENGDRLQTINGFDVSSPEKALEAYARLRAGADKLQLQINRRGTDSNLDYNIK
jgi:general secretion pathway protein C